MFWFLILLPWCVLLVTALLALVHTFSRWQPRTWFYMRNAGAVWTVLVCLFIVAVTVICRVIYTSGGCVRGLKSPAECAHISNDIGQLVHDIFLVNIVAGQFVIPGALILALITEAMTRSNRTAA